ncbi:MAG: XRE family transcriptional regulator [Alphaproteobacteria bacterium]|nr:XRE family transcriptional regulator [Alphaproteobacteria bacterium]
MLQKPAHKEREFAQELGARLRKHRKDRGLTMQEVADGAGLTAGFISQVERNLATPSLASLTSIAEVMGCHVTDILEPPRSDGEISREALRELYNVPGGDFSYERLSTTFPGSQLTAVLIHRQPGRRSEPMRHRGEELYFVLKGALTVTVDGEESVLQQGDSIHFDSRRLHHSWNHSDDETVIVVCNTIDVFGDEEKPAPRTKKRPQSHNGAARELRNTQDSKGTR